MKKIAFHRFYTEFRSRYANKKNKNGVFRDTKHVFLFFRSEPFISRNVYAGFDIGNLKGLFTESAADVLIRVNRSSRLFLFIWRATARAPIKTRTVRRDRRVCYFTFPTPDAADGRRAPRGMRRTRDLLNISDRNKQRK